MKRVFLVLPLLVVFAVGCGAWVVQDQKAITNSSVLTASAWCDLAAIDAGPLVSTRAKIHAAHAEEVGALRRNKVDAGGIDFPCP